MCDKVGEIDAFYFFNKNTKKNQYLNTLAVYLQCHTNTMSMSQKFFGCVTRISLGINGSRFMSHKVSVNEKVIYRLYYIINSSIKFIKY